MNVGTYADASFHFLPLLSDRKSLIKQRRYTGSTNDNI